MKIAIITGASSGMGREAVEQIAKKFNGIDEIWVVARRMDRLTELDNKIGKTLRKFALDLKKENTVKQLQQALEREKPDVKWLINSAGYGKIGCLQNLDNEDIMGMVDVNCKALCTVTHMVLPYMSTNSRILNFASAAAFMPQPEFSIYAASKAFVLSFSRAINAELRHRQIYVTAVCPGPVKTEFFDIAETTGKVKLYKMLVMADPVKVVKLALRDSAMGKSVSVYGLAMKAFHLICNIIPHKFLLKIMNIFSTKGTNKE